ncbi:MAG: S8 family serine peptidase [Moraxellaceae bacterium]|nr:S8 family serine peptidase [Moraxellaceae bacterium]
MTRPPVRLLFRLLSVALLLGPVVTQAQEVARVIVKYRSNDSLGAAAQAQAMGAMSAATQLGGRSGVALHGKRFVGPTTQVVSADGMSSQALADRLMRQGLVEYAVPDEKMWAMAAPNDPKYAAVQWYLQSTEASAIHAETAWNVTTGSSLVVVAVLDTGVLNHPDLAAKLRPGWDFVSENPGGGFTVANDGDGRDADASDPGDWTTVNGVFRSSSWHGTRVSGVLAASTNNGTGIAGVAQLSPILPVRVLGSGGGYVSDIVAGMRWAAGLSVPGAPTNANPARIINMSLGGLAGQACNPVYQEAVNEVLAIGVTVVAAAGNVSDGNLPGAVTQPANCTGVIAVGGARNAGNKAGYSFFGPALTLLAPSGNCGSSGGCTHPIHSTTNTGTTVPGTDAYSDDLTSTVYGTSFATPLVSGVAALMLARNTDLLPDEIADRLKRSSRAFVAEGATPTCSLATPTPGPCNCTTDTCGAGLLYAPQAVVLALEPMARIASVPSTVLPGTVLLLDGTPSRAISGASLVSYTWSLAGLNGSLTSPALSTTNLSLPVLGTYTVTLTVTDNHGRSNQRQVSIQAANPPPPATPAAGGGGGGAFGWIGLAGLLAAAYAARRSSRSATAQALPPR